MKIIKPSTIGFLLLTACGPVEWEEENNTEIERYANEDVEMVKKASTNGWSQTGHLQSTVSSRRVTLQVNFPISSMYTVQFRIGNYTAGRRVSATADITWTVEGNQIHRTISITNGTSISGVGQSVSISAYDNGHPVPLLPPDQFEYDLTINVAPGTRSPIQQPPVLVPWIQSPDTIWRPGTLVLPGLSGQNIFVPKDVGVISMFTTASTIPNPIVLTEANITVAQVLVATRLKQYDPRVEEWVPVSPQVDIVRFENFLPVAPANVVMFSLTYGIDG